MEPRFTRQPDKDLRRANGDMKDANAWTDHHPRWDQADLRFFPVDVNPNADPRYLND